MSAYSEWHGAARHIVLGLAMAAASLHVQWHHSTALGTYSPGALADGVRLPPAGRAFLTWDPVLRRSPNRAWRRFGTDRLVRTVLTVARGFHAAHPRAPRLLVGDLSRPHGGDFGPASATSATRATRTGSTWTCTPRARTAARRLLATPRDIDRALSQELVDRFLAAGAALIFVGPNTALRGPPGRVEPLVQHDNHLHVRLPPGRTAR